jgi:hypothetical protein
VIWRRSSASSFSVASTTMTDSDGMTLPAPWETSCSSTNAIKRRQFDAFGLPPELMADFRLDHAIPLSLGGAPADERNLQLLDEQGSERKDMVERCLSRAVFEGRRAFADAQRLIWNDWCTAKSH